jgi:predicted nucleic acid-binding protein
MIAALFRKVRTGELTPDQARQAVAAFRQRWARRYRIVNVSAAIADQAMSLAERHPLRGYDAVHLAAALAVREAQFAAQLPPLTFVSADDAQLQIAAVEGLSVENPNAYP